MGNGSLLATYFSLNLNRPSGMAIDSTGALYVADLGNHRVVKFSQAGQLLQVFNTTGLYNFSSNRSDLAVTGVAVDARFRVWVADQVNNRVVQFNPNGSVGFVLPVVSAFGVAVDSTGSLYIGAGYGGLYKWNGNTASNATLLYNTDQSGYNGYLFEPYGIALDGRNGLFVVGQASPGVLQISASGVPLQVLVPSVSGVLYTYAYNGVTLDSMGALFVSQAGGIVRYTNVTNYPPPPPIAQVQCVQQGYNLTSLTGQDPVLHWGRVHVGYPAVRCRL